MAQNTALIFSSAFLADNGSLRFIELFSTEIGMSEVLQRIALSLSNVDASQPYIRSLPIPVIGGSSLN